MSKRRQIKLPKAATPIPAESTEPMEVEKPNRYVRASVYLPPAVHKQLRKLAFETERSQHEIIRDWIAEGLRRETGKSWDELVAAE